MKLLAALRFVSLALAAPAHPSDSHNGLSVGVNLDSDLGNSRSSSPLDVKLELQGNSEVKAVVTNQGERDLKVLRLGTLLDSTPVEKVAVLSARGQVPFGGIKLRLIDSSLPDDAFEAIPAGGSLSVTFDLAEVYDLSDGGPFNITSSGALSYAEVGSNELTGSAPYSSNVLQASIDGILAASVRVSFLSKRVHNQDCKGERLEVTKTALGDCESMSRAASEVAMSGSSSKMREYFKSSSLTTRLTVARTLNRVADECSTLDGGVSDYYCSDPYGFCSEKVLAYTLASENYTAYCDLYFSRLRAVATVCHGQDQGSTNIHEMTHLKQIKGTSDYGGYGYKHVQSLSREQNLNHADTYALFAQSIAFGC
ncbi:deuterolysin metalloprotease (M35) family protein [Sarocladium implicatum]|nr:deuterolysin metalloprotease (M35) family protein [Sarocladium implicatum]